MKIGEQIIYKVTKASPLYTVIEAFQAERQQAIDRIHEFTKEVLALRPFDNGYQCVGVEFAGDIIPDTWKRGRNVGGAQVSIPKTQTKAGRELQRRMDELTIPGSAVFAKMIHAGTDSVTVMHGPGDRMGGFRVRNARFDFIDGVYYVIVPIIPGNFTEPNIVEGGTRIRESEFIRILEDAGAAPYDTPGALPSVESASIT
jgi:hypothetical protein